MRVSTVVALALIFLLAISVPGAIAAVPAASPSGPAHTSVDSHAAQSTTSPTDATQPTISDQSMPDAADPAQVIRINVSEDGDATWTVKSRFLLTDDEETEAFVEYADAVSSGERDDVYDRDLFEPHVRTAEETTDREMSIEDEGWQEPSLESPDDDEYDDDTKVGVLSYSFTWTNFATVDGNQIRFGDALQTDDGSWFSMLAEEQRLEIQSPPNYGFHDYNLPVSPQDGALVIDGPYQFSEDELEVVFLRGAGDGGNSLGGFLVSEQGLIGGLFLLVLMVGSTSYLLARRSSEVELPAGLVMVRSLWSDPDDSVETTEAASSADSDDVPPGRPPAEPEPLAGEHTADSGQAFAYEEDEAEAENEAEDDGIDPELLSDEERILRLLRRNGGRMKQASIVTETGWSNAKVSQLLSEMDDDEEISKLRIGRENLITLPEVDPTEID
jgi:hypothetical protein